MLMTSVPKQP